MVELKPCPFCGGEADVHKRRSSCRFYADSKKGIPKNGTLEHMTEYPDGRKVYVYSKSEWGAWCLDTACIGRVGKVFPSKEEAIEAWNRRVGESGG